MLANLTVERIAVLTEADSGLSAIAVAKAIRTKPNTETLTRQSFAYSYGERSANCPGAFCYTLMMKPQ